MCRGILPEDVALQQITLLLLVLSLEPHGLLLLLRLLTQAVHQPLLPQGFLLSVTKHTHTDTQEPQFQVPTFVGILFAHLKVTPTMSPVPPSASQSILFS